MPINLINIVHSKTGIPIADLEGKWYRAKRIASEQHNIEEGDSNFLVTVVGTFKKLLGSKYKQVRAFTEAYVCLKTGSMLNVPRNKSYEARQVKAAVMQEAGSKGIPEKLLSDKWDKLSIGIQQTKGYTTSDLRFLPEIVDRFRNTYKISGAGRPSNAKPPTAKTLPLGINPEAIPLWQQVLTKKKKQIYDFEDNLHKWAAAIYLFKMLCSEKGVGPWDNSKPTSKKAVKDPAEKYISSFALPCLETIAKMEKYLTERNFLIKNVAKKYKFQKIQKQGNDKFVIASKPWRLKKVEQAASIILLLMPQFGLRKGPAKNAYQRKHTPNSTLYLKYKRKSDSLIEVVIEIKIGSRLWKSLEDSKKDVTKFLNTWVNRGFKTLATPYNMEIIERAYPINDRNSAINLLNTMNVPMVVNSGPMDFQLDMCLYLKRAAEKFDLVLPEPIVKFISSQEYRVEMNKAFMLKMQDSKEEEKQEPLGPIIYQEE